MTRSDLAVTGFIVAGVIFVFAVAVLIGLVMSTLPFILGGFLAFVLVVLVAALLAPEVRAFWSKLPR